MAKARVLVAEPDPEQRSSIEKMLAGLGYALAASTSSADEALRLCMETRPDVAVVDVLLDGEGDGIAAAGRIRSAANLPVILLAPDDADPTLARANAIDHFGYLLKPVGRRELHAALAVAMHRFAAESTLRRSDDWLSLTLNSILDAVIAIDQSGRITFLNPVAESLTGWPAQDAQGRALEEVCTIKSEGIGFTLQSLLMQVVGMGQIKERTNHAFLISKEGRRTRIEYSAAPMKSPAGDITGAVVVLRDMSATIRFQDQVSTLSRAVEQSPVSVVITDTEGCIQYVNPKFTEVSGYAAEELMGQNPRILKSGKTSAAEYRAMWKAITGGGEWQGEFCNRRKDGTLYWEHASISPVRSVDGTITHFVGVKEEVTARKRIELALQESEEFFRGIFEQAAVGVVLTSVQGTVMRANRAFCGFIGFSEEELLLRHFGEFTHVDDRAVSGEAARLLLSGEAPTHTFDKRYVHKSGASIWANVTIAVLRTREGEARGFVTITVDISERKKAEEALSRERILLRTLIDNLPDAIYVKDREHRKTLSNKADLEVMGLRSEDDARGKRDADLFPDEQARRYAEDDRMVIESGIAVINREEALAGRGGDKRWFLTTKVPLRDARGDIAGLIGIGREITDRKSAEEVLRSNEEKFREMAEATPSAIFIFEGDRVQYANRQASALTGFSLDELRGIDPGRLVHPEFRTPFLQAISNAVTQNGVSGHREIDLQTRDGGHRWVDLAAGGMEFAGKRAVICSAYDISGRVHAEEDLRFRNVLLSAQQETSPDGILVVDQGGRIILFNRRFVDLMRIPPTLVPPEGTSPIDDEPILQHVTALVANPGEFLARVRYLYDNPDEQCHDEILLKDGRTLERHSLAMRGPEGKYYGRIWYFRDITDRKHSVEVLKESERRLAEIIQFFPEATMVVDASYTVIAWNAAMEDLTGIRAGEMIGKGQGEYAMPFYGTRRPLLLDLVVRPLSVVKAAYPYVKAHGDTLESEVEVPMLRGRAAHLHVTATVLRNSKGDITGAIETLRDTTRRKIAEASLRASEERFRLISENVADLITVLDARGTCVYASPSFRLEGITPATITGADFMEYIHPDDVPAVRRVMDDALSTRRHQSLEFRFRRSGGEWRFKEASLSLLVDDEAVRVVSVMRDVTERIGQEKEMISLQSQLKVRNRELEAKLAEIKNMQDGLVQSEKMASIGQLTAGIAHEINNPLAFVASNLNRFEEYFGDVLSVLRAWESMKEDLEKSGQFPERVAAVRSAEQNADLAFAVDDFAALMKHTKDGTGRIKTIVERLRGFTHLAGDGFVEADLNEAIEETLSITWNELKYKADVVREYGEMPVVTCNIGEIKQVLVNLLVNAAHAMEAKGTITVRTSCRGDRAIIQVVDTGTGISPANMKKIFDPFFTTKPVGKGTGLGLWISATIIQKHGGKLAASSSEGKGTTMTIDLPLRQSRSAEAPA